MVKVIFLKWLLAFLIYNRTFLLNLFFFWRLKILSGKNIFYFWLSIFVDNFFSFFCFYLLRNPFLSFTQISQLLNFPLDLAIVILFWTLFWLCFSFLRNNKILCWILLLVKEIVEKLTFWFLFFRSLFLILKFLLWILKFLDMTLLLFLNIVVWSFRKLA